MLQLLFPATYRYFKYHKKFFTFAALIDLIMYSLIINFVIFIFELIQIL